MREIKFRAWEKHAKRMAEVTVFKWQPDHLYHQVYTRAIVNQKMIDEWYAYDFGSDSNGIILMQYTGLKDKNGKEIYEGDIVENTTQTVYLGHKFEVTWNENYAVYQLMNNGLTSNIPLIQDFMSYEVIGNIFEDKELLNHEV